ncbi:hypothetical protein [Cystobacter ferrugineus]|uniref:DUF4177 domain-containing protein n=1 Tax=Cystobacter ferrugineus TaxID=83449 RepID=A0A1L9B9T0_9BACT|nr:hypothetical protein [Cystobacter ferrugineus]OJH38988.1 hypothetical protein BON30_22550 [Cystobacter ferrugineus]
MAPRKKKRPPSRKAALPPAPRRAARAGKRPGAARAAVAPAPVRALQYKVVELSTVDEGTLERTVNEWSAQGWNLDGVQFAMRESSKRPAMAFVFFTREGAPAAHDVEAARGRLREMAETGSPSARLVASPDFTGNAAASSSEYVYSRPPGMVSAHERLAQLAGLDEPERPERGLILEPDE